MMMMMMMMKHTHRPAPIFHPSCCLENISEQYKQRVLSSPVDIFYLLAAMCSFWIFLFADVLLRASVGHVDPAQAAPPSPAQRAPSTIDLNERVRFSNEII